MPDYAKTTASSRRLSLSSNAGSVTSEAPPRQNGYRVHSNGARPGTSQSVRPESSMSVRGQSNAPLVVKKARAPARPRPETKTSQVRRKSPLNDGSASADAPKDPPSRSNSVALPTIETSTSASQASDIDSLTSGMKKVKISLTTKAQREAKAAAKSAAAKPTASKAARPAPARKESVILPPARQHTPASEMNGTSKQQSEQTRDTLPTMPSTPQPSIPTHLRPNDVPLPASSPPAPTSHTDFPPTQPQPQPQQPPKSTAPAPQPATTPDVFIPYQPEGPTPPTFVSSTQEPLRWLEPNTNTPSPMKGPGAGVKKGDLPVWTATSAIPFGVPGMAQARPLVKGGEVLRGDGNGSGDVNMSGANEVGGEIKKEKEVDIWEVPETPGR